MAHTKSVQFYRNNTVITPANQKSALTLAKESIEASGSTNDGEMTLVRYQEDNDDPIKTLVGVYHRNGNSGSWTYLTENFNKWYMGESPASCAATYQKVATTEIFPVDSEGKPLVGTVVAIKYLAANTYKTAGNIMSLNVNNTGAYPIYYSTAEYVTTSSANTTVVGAANRYVYYIFNGSQWVWLNHGADNNTTTEIVNITDEGNGVYSCDKTNAEIYAAWQDGRTIYAVLDDDYMYQLAGEPGQRGAYFVGTSYDELYITTSFHIVTPALTNVQEVREYYFDTYSKVQIDEIIEADERVIAEIIADFNNNFDEINQTIEDDELAIAAALNELNETVEQNELVTAGALTQLSNTIEENELTTAGALTQLSNVIEENEEITAQALADLDERITANTNALDNIVVDQMISITYADLFDLVENGELLPGMFYRITDYETMTAQADTQSAGHPFDVIVLALDEYTLSERAWATMREDDDYFSNYGCNLNAWELKYCIYNDTDRFAWAIPNGGGQELRLYKSDGYTKEIDEGDSHIDSHEYFAYIGEMEYDGDTYYAWKKYEGGDPTDVIILTTTLYQPGSLDPGDDIADVFDGTAATVAYTLAVDSDEQDVVYQGLNHNSDGEIDEYVTVCQYGTVSGNDSVQYGSGGKGVIYYMKDEYNNECPYDFKNIQFKRQIARGVDDERGPDTFVYTFTWIDDEYAVSDASIVGNSMISSDNYIYGVHDNSFDFATIFDDDNADLSDISTLQHVLNNNVFLGSYYYDDSDYFDGFYNNRFGAGSSSNSFYISACNNTIGNGCKNNVFHDFCHNSAGTYFYDNVGTSVYRNTIGNFFNNNLFRNSARDNSFGNGCIDNTFGDNFHYNSFGNNCTANTFGAGCQNNSLGNGCWSNNFGDNCVGNGLGNECTSLSIGGSSKNNTFGNGCTNSSIGSMSQRNHFGDKLTSCTFSGSTVYNNIGNYCSAITAGTGFQSNTIGNNCSNLSFGTYNKNNTIGNGVYYFKVTGTDGTTLKSYVNFIIVENGNQYITVTTNQTTSLSVFLRNFHIVMGVNNTTTTKTIAHNTVNDVFKTTYQPINSKTFSV